MYLHILYTGIDSAVMEERRKGCQELSEVQSLLEVARREQAKTALDLQRTERKVRAVYLLTSRHPQCMYTQRKLDMVT